MLRDRNTVKMIAEHWACSVATVYRRIESGALDCLRLDGIIRVTREQVEAYEKPMQHGKYGSDVTQSFAPTARQAGDPEERLRQHSNGVAGTSCMGLGANGAFLRGQMIGPRRSRNSRRSKSGAPPVA
jgi:hypothetical protein